MRVDPHNCASDGPEAAGPGLPNCWVAKLCISMSPGMAERLPSLLHQYRLQARNTQRLRARSDLHSDAWVRVQKKDVESLTQEPDNTRTLVALFSTRNVDETVCLRSAERVYVQVRNSDGPDEWVPLRVSASHAYVQGMRVSGIIHRAIVRLVRE